MSTFASSSVSNCSQERLKVPMKQAQTKTIVAGRWLLCVRLRPTQKDHVWSYDFVADRTSEGRAFRMLTLIDEHSRECLAIDVAQRSRARTYWSG
jgi:putative transposase